MSRKRGNGEGTIHRRKTGGWCAQFTVYTAKGRKRKTLYGRTRAEVAAKLTKVLSDREGGLSFDAKNLMLSEYLDLWLRDSVKDTVRLTTYQVTSASCGCTSSRRWGASNSRTSLQLTCAVCIGRD